jgi:hypothetical protein
MPGSHRRLVVAGGFCSMQYLVKFVTQVAEIGIFAAAAGALALGMLSFR